MYPYDKNPVIDSVSLAATLGDGYALDDGQCYTFDVISRSYHPYSDHYDKDHYDYYKPYLNNYKSGSRRGLSFEQNTKHFFFEHSLEIKEERLKTKCFEKLKTTLAKIKCAKLLRAVNCQIEDLINFNNKRDWRELMIEAKFENDCFFNSKFIFSVENKQEFFRLITYFPQQIAPSFRLTNAIICVPSEEGGTEVEDDDDIYELTISLLPQILPNSYIGRKQVNDYFELITIAVEEYIESCN